MSTQHRIALIGIGAVAEAIAQAISKLPNARLIAGSCRTESKGRAFASKYACTWYPDSNVMLDTEHPTVAIVATPSGTHLDHVTSCATRHIHTLCEKPLEISTARINQMIAVAAQNHIILGGIFPQRFNPVIQTLHTAASQGRFGNLSTIHAAVPWWREDSYYGNGRWQGTRSLDGGGAMINQAIHSIDIVQYLAAAAMPTLPADINPVEEVFAYTAIRGHDPARLEVEDTAVALLKFRNGALGQILAATSMYPGSLRRLTISGRDGTAELQEDQLLQFHFRTPLPTDPATLARFGSATTHAGGSSNPMAFDYSKHERNIAAFLQAVDSNQQPPLSAPESSKAVAIIEACYQSAQSNRPVRL
jgi:predicted dehydrogenase